MLYERQGILQAKQLSIRQCFFLSHCCFMPIPKTSEDTNVGQSHRLHCMKNLHRYNLKSLIFKHSLLFIHTFKNTTQLLKTFCKPEQIRFFRPVPGIYRTDSQMNQIGVRQTRLGRIVKVPLYLKDYVHDLTATSGLETADVRGGVRQTRYGRTVKTPSFLKDYVQ